MKIHKRNVRNSIWVPIPGVFILLVLGMMINAMTDNHLHDYMAVLTVPFGLMVIGIIVWFPALLICLLIESFTINDRTGVGELLGILVLEALVPVIIFHLIMGDVLNEITPVSVLLAFMAQSMRWIYLRSKKRMFVQPHSEEE